MFRRLNVFALAILALAWLSATPRGQGNASPQALRVTIVGSVVDATLAPIPGVTVVLDQNGQTTTRAVSDAQGAFRFTAIAPGDYRVRAELAGFAPLAKDRRRQRVGHDPVAVGHDAGRRLRPQLGHEGRVGRALVRDTDRRCRLAFRSGDHASSACQRRRRRRPRRRGSIVGQCDDGRHQRDEHGEHERDPERRDGKSNVRAAAGTIRRTGRQPELHLRRAEPLPLGAGSSALDVRRGRRHRVVHQRPPVPLERTAAAADAVRVEDFVNYFHFDYAEPRDNRPIALTTEIGDCPWAPAHKLVLIGARARAAVTREIAGRNIVLLIDVSGSMAPAERLPLIKTALGMFVDTLRPDDRLAIVTYAGYERRRAAVDAGARARRDPARDRAALGAGGSTNGGQGLITAYRTAREAFIPGGVNRVILATDGDFNVGVVEPTGSACISSNASATPACSCPSSASARDNLKDATMEMLADKGNGHYAYLDSLQEARRVLVREGDATLETVAKDVKFQVEFNPAIGRRLEADRLRRPARWRRRTSTTIGRTAARWARATRSRCCTKSCRSARRWSATGAMGAMTRADGPRSIRSATARPAQAAGARVREARARAI